MDLNTDNNALWKRRMRSPRVLCFSVARNKPSVGLIVTNADGKDKTYLWNPQTGIIDDKPCLEEDYYGIFSPDGKYLHYFKDTKGNQHGHRWRMNVGTGEHENLTPDLPEYYAYRTAFSDDSRYFAFLANFGNTTTVYLFSFDENGNFESRRAALETTDSIVYLRMSPDGRLLAFSSAENGKTDTGSIFILDTATLKNIKKFSAENDAFAYPHMFLPDTSKLVISIEEGSTQRCCIWDCKTDQLEELQLDKTITNRICDISTDGSRLLISQEFRARQRFLVYDIKIRTYIALESLDGVSHPFQIAGNDIYIRNSCSKHKSRVLTYDVETAQRKATLELPGTIETTQAQEIHFTGALGDKVYGWLKKPEGKGPFPTIIEMPGGPDCAWDWYEPEAYLEHGFARFFFSYHGAPTFGEDFRKSIIGRIGELELEDMIAARNWLVEKGIADPDKIFLMGGSYGGYLTLFGMVKRPDLWRGGLARTPVANWIADWEDTNGELRKCNQYLFDCAPDLNPDLWAKSSPITYIENLKAPLLIIAGKNDTRCPRRQNEVFIQKAKELGKDIEEYWFDEGHGSSVVDEQIHQVELRLKFLKRVLET